jgi:general secretion pathway protein M
MRQAATEIQVLRQGATKRNPAGGSLLATTDSSARAHGLAKAVKRVQPEGQRSVRVWLEQAPFDDVMLWLNTLAGDYGIRVDGVVVDPTDAPGLVDLRAVLEETT